MLAFAPMLLMIGQTGDYVLSLGQVVTILLLSSWFLSMYLTTSSCSWFMKVDPRQLPRKARADPYQGKFYQLYRGFLETALRKRVVVIGLTVGALALACSVSPSYPKSSSRPATGTSSWRISISRLGPESITPRRRLKRSVTGWKTIGQSGDHRHGRLRRKRGPPVLPVSGAG